VGNNVKERFGDVYLQQLAEQLRLAQTRDHAEGIKAVTERRNGQFTRS
jgi:hypothetical protein